MVYSRKSKWFFGIRFIRETCAKEICATYEIRTPEVQHIQIAKESNEAYIDVMMNPRLPGERGYCRPIEQSLGTETELARLQWHHYRRFAYLVGEAGYHSGYCRG